MNEAFERARVLYRKVGTVRGYEYEWAVFCKKVGGPINQAIISEQIEPVIRREMAHKAAKFNATGWPEPWMNFKTWLNDAGWTKEFPEVENAENKPKRTAAESREGRANEIIDLFGNSGPVETVDHSQSHGRSPDDRSKRIEAGNRIGKSSLGTNSP